MKSILISIVLFLNFFCKLASGQWNDDTLLLRNFESQSLLKKKKSIKVQTSVESEKKRQPNSVQEDKKAKLPEVILENKEKTELKSTNSSIDLWIGYRKIDQSSKLNYKNINGESPTVGVKASVIISDWIWNLNYDTGFFYQNAKNAQMRLRDENLQIGFLKKGIESSLGIDYGFSYFENQIVNENHKIDFIGNKKSGLSFLAQKNQILDEGTDLVYGIETSPYISYRDTGGQNLTFLGKVDSAMTNIISLGLIEKVSEGNALIANFKYSWTKVAFKGVSSVVDPLTNESLRDVRLNEGSFNIQIGFRWNN